MMTKNEKKKCTCAFDERTSARGPAMRVSIINCIRNVICVRRTGSMLVIVYAPCQFPLISGDPYSINLYTRTNESGNCI